MDYSMAVSLTIILKRRLYLISYHHEHENYISQIVKMQEPSRVIASANFLVKIQPLSYQEGIMAL
jgi:hypothetical protein